MSQPISVDAITNQHLQEVRSVLNSLPLKHRYTVAEWWNRVRGSFNEMHAEIRRLRLRVDAVNMSPGSRPDTTSSVQELRFQYDELLREQGMDAEDISNTMEAISNLPAGWCMAYLVNRRIAGNHALGCWLANLQPAHETGYVKFNLRNTTHPAHPNRKIGYQVWAHQLAVVARG
jgi:hypothetical protein